ncbi:MAG: 2-amino-4-hydroxy-6-hydroxymethyldihydropteridine diphosphokinase [Anaerolineae bacterium]
MTEALIALGSNIEPERNLRDAVARLPRTGLLLAVSPVYESEPVGRPEQPCFLNAVARIACELPPAQLKEELAAIERELGRVRTGDKYAPRTIDLDILLYGDQVLVLGARHVPDPDLLRYAHLALPSADVAPDLRHPETGQTMREIAHQVPARGLRRRPEVLLEGTSPRRS